ncbi:hypothetical protein C480_09290 [Natrialba aegyptia DSM 13077]|uniref:Uncharacterized protein n=2 Tax=Natrialba TaxID=63742 RepID=M0B6K9_9EURY|nr:hypothetical protein C480_09290 [Natrialba aegyptia DSM 13077]
MRHDSGSNGLTLYRFAVRHPFSPGRRTTPLISLACASQHMLKNLGLLGIVGIVVLLAGIGVIAYANWMVAVGIALVLAGLGLVVKSLVSSVLKQFGMF